MDDPALLGRAPLYGKNNVLLCSRHQDRLFVIDVVKRELVWAWGKGEISGPHHAQVLPNGNILLLDNGLVKKRSRAIELDPVRGETVWKFVAPTPADSYTSGRGSVQRLANGNTLICNADHGEIFEVTSAGDVVWRSLCPRRNAEGNRSSMVRAIRYEAAFIEPLLKSYPDPTAPSSRP